MESLFVDTNNNVDTMTSTLTNLSAIKLEEEAIAPCMSIPFSHIENPPKLKERIQPNPTGDGFYTADNPRHHGNKFNCNVDIKTDFTQLATMDQHHNTTIHHTMGATPNFTLFENVETETDSNPFMTVTMKHGKQKGKSITCMVNAHKKEAKETPN